MTWIPVTEQLPPNGEIVEGEFELYTAIHETWYDAEIDRWYFTNFQACVHPPVRWRKKEDKQ